MVTTNYGQFEEIDVHADNVINEITSNHNIAEYDGTRYWCTIDNDTLSMHSSDDFETDDTVEDTITCSYTGGTLTGVACRRFNDDEIYGASTVHDGTDLYMVWIYSTDGGATWTTVETTLTTAYDDPITLDIAYANATVHVVFQTKDPANAVYYRFIKLDGTAVMLLSTGGTDEEKFFAGASYSDGYWFGEQRGTGINIDRFIGTGVIMEYIGSYTVSALSNSDINQQFLIKRGVHLIMVSKDWMGYTPDAVAIAGDIIVQTASNTTSTGLVSSIQGNEYQGEYILFDTYIWNILDSGQLVQIQSWSGAAYGGIDDWFSTGSAIYQYDPTNIPWAAYQISQSLYAAPKISLQGFKQTFANQYLHSYSDADVLLAKFFILSASQGELPYQYRTLHGVEMDLSTPIFGKTYTAQTANEIINDLKDTYCNYLWGGRGTNGDVYDIPSDLSGWPDSSTGSSFIQFVAQKTFISGYTGKNEIYENLLDAYDATNADRVITVLTEGTLNGSIIAINIAGDSVGDYGEWWFRQSGSIVGRIVFNNDNIYWYDGSNNLLQAAVDNTMYHIVLNFKSSTQVDIYIDAGTPSTQSLENNYVGPITYIAYLSLVADFDYHYYWSEIYNAESVSDAMSTLDSISPLPTTTYTFTINNRTVLDVLYLMSLFEGYFFSFRPDNQLYWDTYASSGKTLTDANYTFIGDPVPAELTPSRITVHYNGGNISADGTGNGGESHYYFSELTEAQATTLAAAILAAKNQVITKYKIGITGIQLDVGTSVVATITKHSITAQTMYVVDVQYNAKTALSMITLTDIKWSPYLARNTTDLYQQIENVR